MNKDILKKIILLAAISAMMLSIIACGKKDNTGRTETKSDVEQLLDGAKSEEQTTEMYTEATTEAMASTTTQSLDDTDGQYSPNMASGEITTEFPLATGPSQMDGSGAINPGHTGDDFTSEAPLGDADPNVDVDLTVLSANMVYAEVYNMLMYPDSYLGKTIKVSGPYYPLYYDGTDNYYHYVMIEDALACCQNGMEFIWDEGSHVYPDEYPNKDDVIEIVGELKSYKEEGYIYYYLDIEEYTILESN